MTRPPRKPVDGRPIVDGVARALHTAPAVSGLPDAGLGESMLRRAYGAPIYLGEGSEVVGFPLHLRKMFASWSEEDVGRLDKLMKLRPETVAWVESKNTRELERLDGAVEFISSSRTAAKVLMWVCGTAATVVTGSIALAKSGYDLFSLFRGVGK